MTTSHYNIADINQARQTIGAEAGKFGSVGDGIPQSVDAGMFGTLPSSGAIAQAAGALCSSIRSEYTKAEALVGAIERTLDANLSNTGQTNDNARQSFAAKQA